MAHWGHEHDRHLPARRRARSPRLPQRTHPRPQPGGRPLPGGGDGRGGPRATGSAWSAILDDGELVGGNLLDFSPEYGWITWIGQVMPLFFFVGGFASATSLRSAERRGVAPADWIATRLRPHGHPGRRARRVLGDRPRGRRRSRRVRGRRGRRRRRRHPAVVPRELHDRHRAGAVHVPLVPARTRRCSSAGSSASSPSPRPLASPGIPMIPQLNWVIGWLGFQVAGFAWQDGRLPTGRALAGLAATFWVLAIAAVTVGPWPAVMLHHGGLDHSPTHPPSTALLLFGLAYSFTAAALAPAVTAWLERSRRAWQVTIAANVRRDVRVPLAHDGGRGGRRRGLRRRPAPVRRGRDLGLVAGQAPVPPAEPRRPRPDRPASRPDRAARAPRRHRTVAVGAPVDARRGRPAVRQREGWSSSQPAVLVAGLAGTLCVWRVALADPVAVAARRDGRGTLRIAPARSTGARTVPEVRHRPR